MMNDQDKSRLARVAGVSPAPQTCDARGRHGRDTLVARGFTFVEILATMAFLGIVLPAVMNGISVSLSAAQVARDRAQATALAQGKLAELLAGGQWQHSELSGDFAPDYPDFGWEAVVTDWDGDVLRQLDVTVSWHHRSGERNVSLTSLVYVSTGAGDTATQTGGQTSP